MRSSKIGHLGRAGAGRVLRGDGLLRLDLPDGQEFDFAPDPPHQRHKGSIRAHHHALGGRLLGTVRQRPGLLVLHRQAAASRLLGVLSHHGCADSDAQQRVQLLGSLGKGQQGS